MRITDRMIFDRANRDGGAARARMDAAVARASTGARVVHPGDDPGAAGLIATERLRANRLDAVASTAGRASDELGAADAALSEVSNLVTRAREIATQLSSSPYDAQARADGATEVRGLLSSAVASLNVKVGNRYVLGGFQDGAAPFDPAGNYAGDGGVREVEIAPGVYQAANVRADLAVNGQGGGVDVLGTLTALANALSANDPAAVRATLDPLSKSTDQIASARSGAGAAMATLDAAVIAGQTARDDAKASTSKLADADIIQSASELSLAQRALEASLTATAQSFQLTLLDKLK